MKTIIAALAFVSIAFSAAAQAPEQKTTPIQPFATAKEIDLMSVLPPPPENGSAQMQRELAEVLRIQVTRTPEQVARAAADAEENIWRFADAVDNPAFTPEKLPKVDAFFKRVFKSEGAVTGAAKKFYNRPRPFQYSDLVKPAVKPSLSGAYPSGHATSSTLAAIVLSNMLPEKRRAIMTRAWDYAHNRVVGGMHFATDIEAGRISGSIIAQHISRLPEFQREFDEARAELRGALGL
jgi:acid phosphatase (class A)